MSAGAIEDAGDALPVHEADRPVGDTPEIAAGGKPAQVRPKARTKRPRPTFNDGSVTRVFKFPSKAYPRSSYYVTSTEIIIRIKKARKKWKLVVPKKRVAAYRTNRWFAKPRWVEIELNYTQASKLGLVEPQTPSKEVTSGISAEQEAGRHPIVESNHTLLAGSASEPEPHGASTWRRHSELHPNDDQPERVLSADDIDFAPDHDFTEDDTVVPRSLPHGGSQVPLPQTLPMAGDDVCSRQSTSALAAARPRSGAAASSASAFLLIASSTVVLVSVAAAWIALGGFPTTPTTVDPVCTRSEQLPPCTLTIVTGAMGKVDQPEWPVPRPSAAFATHASSEPLSATEQLQLSAPQIPKTAATPTEREDGSGKVGNRVDNGHERTRTANAAVESEPLPAAKTPMTSLLLPQNVPAHLHDCRELRAASRSINIRFGYGSSSLNRTILPALEAFAVRLRSCPSTKVIIEGHTDSDGRAAWNHSLSVHRAKAVLKHLVHAGVQPSQLSAVGFGQSRPYAPNLSIKNKRRNRRVALVVDVPR
jgi:outer membrane protein OmpA-like peptidoglycan-associated protein